MSHNTSQKCKRLCCVIFLEILAFLFSCCASMKTTMLEGITPEMKESIKTQYGITIPNEAVFENGMYSFTARDSYLVIIFSIPIDLSTYNNFSSEKQLCESIIENKLFTDDRWMNDQSKFVLKEGDNISMNWPEEFVIKMNYGANLGNSFTQLSASIVDTTTLLTLNLYNRI